MASSLIQSYGKNLATFDLTIAASASLSNAVELGPFALAAIEMPGTWTAANLTFTAASTLGGTYKDLYDDAGVEVVVVAAASRIIAVDFLARCFAPLRFLKIRSGTTGSPVTQDAARTVTLILKAL